MTITAGRRFRLVLVMMEQAAKQPYDQGRNNRKRNEGRLQPGDAP
jgi:hypothetical protein